MIYILNQSQTSLCLSLTCLFSILSRCFVLNTNKKVTIVWAYSPPPQQEGIKIFFCLQILQILTEIICCLAYTIENFHASQDMLRLNEFFTKYNFKVFFSALLQCGEKKIATKTKKRKIQWKMNNHSHNSF